MEHNPGTEPASGALRCLQVPSGLPFNSQEELVGTRAWCGDASCNGTIIFFFVPYENSNIRGVQLLLLVLRLQSATLDCAAERAGGKRTLYCNNLKFNLETWCERRRCWVFLMWWMQANRCPRTVLHCCCPSNFCSSNWNYAVTGFTHTHSETNMRT